MGEETNIVEPMSSKEGVAAEAEEPSKEQRRKRKKLLYKSLCELMEFYLGDVNLSKDRFIAQHIQGKPFVYMDLSKFLTFNKVRALTANVEDIAKAISRSEILQVSEDGTQVCRKTPIKKKENEDDCTIYVEQLGPDVDHDLLTKVFSEFGHVDYVSLPRYSHNGKFKGFAFVEFNNPESAKRALEALNERGCCLSPQMAPEELLSIKNFDTNKENIKDEKVDFNHIKNKENQYGEAGASEDNSKEELISNELGNKNTKKGKMKRKYSGGSEQIKSKKFKSRDKEVTKEFEEDKEESAGESKADETNEQQEEKEDNLDLKKEDQKRNRGKKKDKTNHVKEGFKLEKEEAKREGKLFGKKRKHSADKSEIDSSTHQKSKSVADVLEKETIKSEENIHKKKRQNSVEKSDADPNIQQETKDTPAVDGKLEKEENTDEEKHVGRKRKHSADQPDSDSNSNQKPTGETTETPVKKLKSETEVGSEAAVSQSEGETHDDTEKQKKKRKRKKKLKKNRTTVFSLGLKVLSKKEWKKLRNQYLNMQKQMMGSLKQHLAYSRFEKNKPLGVEQEQEEKQKFQSGTVIKVTLEEPVANRVAAKSELRVHPEIKYVDVEEGRPCVYLRTSSPEVAQTLMEAKHFPNMQILQGDEETAYMNKIKADRESYQKKNKHNQRGRTKLLKRAEKFQGKHITTFESSPN